MRIATFNLENLDDGPRVDPPLGDRLAILRPRLLRLRADILCLQEVNAQRRGRHGPRHLAALDRLLEDTPYADYGRAVTVGSGGRGPLDHHNLVLLSRFPIVEAGQVRNDIVDAPVYRPTTARPRPDEPEPLPWDRPIQHVTLRLGDGRPLHVLNLHLRAPSAAPVAGQKIDPQRWRTVGGWAEGCFVAAIKRSGQALEARLLVDRLLDADPAAAVVVCGDLNATVDEVPVRLIRGVEDDTGNAALAPRALVPLERSVDAGRRYSVLHRGRPQMLDHILVSQTVLGWYAGIEIHNEDLVDEAAADGGALGSFHAPVVASFVLPGERE